MTNVWGENYVRWEVDDYNVDNGRTERSSEQPDPKGYRDRQSPGVGGQAFPLSPIHRGKPAPAGRIRAWCPRVPL